MASGLAITMRCWPNFAIDWSFGFLTSVDDAVDDSPTGIAMCRKRLLLTALRTSGYGTQQPALDGWSIEAPPPISDLDLFCNGESVIDLDSEISDCTLNLCVTE